jgi:hypothetical protein
MGKKSNNKVVPVSQVERMIYLLRGHKVMVDSDLATLYGVPTKVLNQAVRRNRERFPEDFMFQLSEEQFNLLLRSQIVASSEGNRSQIVTGSGKTSKKPKKNDDFGDSNRSQTVTGSQKHRDPRFHPYVFTEQGVAMLSSILRSPRAVQVNIEIMRTFVKLRQWLASSAHLSRRLDTLERKYDAQFKIVFDAIREMVTPFVESQPKKEMGFHTARPKQENRVKALSKSLQP